MFEEVLIALVSLASEYSALSVIIAMELFRGSCRAGQEGCIRVARELDCGTKARGQGARYVDLAGAVSVVRFPKEIFFISTVIVLITINKVRKKNLRIYLESRSIGRGAWYSHI